MKQFLFNGPNLELFRYLAVGGVNVVLTCIIYVAGLYMLHLHHLIALSAAFLCGNVFTYVLNFVWVFKPEPELRFRARFMKYLSSNASTFAFNLALLYGAVDMMGADPLLAQLLLMGPLIVLNFLLAKYWSLRTKK